MKPAKRLAPVARLAKDEEQQAAMRLAEAKRIMERHRQRLTELEGFLDDYRQRYITIARSGMNLQHARQFQAFIAQIETAIHHERDIIQNAQYTFIQRHAQWQQCHGRTQAIDHVIDRYQSADAKHQARQEQKASDEVGQRLLNTLLKEP